MFIRFNMHFWKIIWRIRSVIATLILIIVSGALLISTMEQLPFGKALYFSFITGLTIGYGDVVATTAVGQFISILLGVVGILFTGLEVAAAVYVTQRALHDVYGSE